MNTIIEIKQGRYFPKPAVLGGYIFLFFGIFSVFDNWPLGLSLLLLGIYLSLTFCGVEIDLNKKLFREYVQYFGIKSGKWIELDKYSDLSILKSKEKSTIYSRTNIATSDSTIYYDLFLLSKSHRTKILLKRYSNKEEALEEGNNYAIKLDKELKNYNPQGSYRKK